MSDILDEFAKFRSAFRELHLKPPTAILLGSHEEGMKFLSQIRQQERWEELVDHHRLGKPIEMADGSVWMECIVLDIPVRWPASRLGNPDGSWKYA